MRAHDFGHPMTAPLIIAHRGFSRRHPENTFAAFEAAIAAGADAIELDLTLSADGEFVVIHDETLDRTTDASGLVCDYTREQLQAIDAGKGFGTLGNTLIPTLDDVLTHIAPRCAVNLEIKPLFPIEQAEAFQMAMGRLIQQLHESQLLNRVWISSFNFFVLRWLRAQDTKLRLAFLYTRSMTDLDPVFACQQVGAFACNPNERETTKAFISRLHAAGLQVFPYTVNEPKRMQQLMQWGADGFFTDVPDVLRGCLRQQG